MASALHDLVSAFRREGRIPESWIARFSASGDHREAIARAWAAAPDPRPMVCLAAYWADAEALAALAADAVGPLLALLPAGQEQRRQALAWRLSRTREPSPAPAEGGGDKLPAPPADGTVRHSSIERDCELTSIVTRLVEAAARIDSQGSSVVATVAATVAGVIHAHVTARYLKAGGPERTWTPEEIESNQALAEEEVLGPLADLVRARLPVPSDADLMRALSALRAETLDPRPRAPRAPPSAR
jgi:hypothetical protein